MVAATSIGASSAPQLGAEVVVEAGAERPQHLQLGLGERLAAPRPEHGPQLGHRRERDPVVDAVDVAARDRQQVAGLAIRVVDRRVEHRDRPQALVLVDHEPHRVDGRVDLDPQLDHALAERAVAEHGRRDDAPAAGLRHRERRDLAPGERPVREVVQRPLAHDRLVDARRDEVGLRVGAAARREAQQGVVRRRPQAAHDRQLALGQQLERDGLGQDRHRQAEIVDRARCLRRRPRPRLEAVVIDAIEIDGLELVPVVHAVAADP